MKRPPFLPLCSAALLALLLAACGSAPKAPDTTTVAKAPKSKKPGVAIKRGGGYYLDDGPGEEIPENLDDIPDATPRREPLARAANKPYVALGKEYVPNTELKPYRARGIGSWYGKKYHGQKTSIGDTYDMFGMTAAHPTLAIPSYVRVTNVANGKSVVVRVNDRGPFHSDRVIDLSYTAAWKLGYVDNGSATVEVEAIIPDASGGFLASSGPAPMIAPPTVTPPTPAPKPVAVADNRNTARELQEQADLELRLRRAETAAPANANGVFLQLGAFASADNAESLKARLGKELDWLGQPIQVIAGNGLHRVHVGPYRNRADADQIAEKIRLALGFKPTTVVR
jgi:rare lipoprotein A